MTVDTVLAIDLGTSTVKVALLTSSLDTVASAGAPYPTLNAEPSMAEQRPRDWLAAISSSVRVCTNVAPEARIRAVVLCAQLPTLVAIDGYGNVIGNAVTWQDSRADGLVLERLDADSRRRVHELSGAPVDGRYLIPMHLRKLDEPGYSPSRLLSAKDFLMFKLTGVLLTDPSTGSGFGNLDLATGAWSDELTALWALDPALLPELAHPGDNRPLTTAGARYLPGVAPGTPVLVGAADSVSAHHYITRLTAGAISVIHGSSTVILADLDNPTNVTEEFLCTPLVDPRRTGAELDLLATGSSVAWLANLFALTPLDVEAVACDHPAPERNEVLFYPYLAGGEQGALWQSDLQGSITGLSLSTNVADLARALFEGVAFETWRCVRLLSAIDRTGPVVLVANGDSRHLGASLLAALTHEPVTVLEAESPSLLGSALLAWRTLGTEVVVKSTMRAAAPLPGDQAAALMRRAKRYFAHSPTSDRLKF